MKRAGFTMIELIFVIVILGILAAVALPKFAGVSDQANAQKCNAFVGTLNRTVGPSMWSESISANDLGVVSGNVNVVDYIALEDIPFLCLDETAVLTSANVDAALFANNGPIQFGANQYDINFTDGNITSSPKWGWNAR